MCTWVIIAIKWVVAGHFFLASSDQLDTLTTHGKESREEGEGERDLAAGEVVVGARRGALLDRDVFRVRAERVQKPTRHGGAVTQTGGVLHPRLQCRAARAR